MKTTILSMKTKVYYYVEILMWILASCGVQMVIVSIITFFIYDTIIIELLIIGFVISIPSVIILWYILIGRLFDWRTTLLEIKIIRNINENGFEIKSNDNLDRISWDEVNTIKLDDKENLLINKRNKENLIVGKDYLNWYLLVKNLPNNKFVNDQIPNFASEIFDNLTTCEICGKIAVYKLKCLSCLNNAFESSESKGSQKKHEYIREEQLDYFSTLDKDEEITFRDDTLEDYDGFEYDEKWYPIVSKEDILIFSKENYWD